MCVNLIEVKTDRLMDSVIGGWFSGPIDEWWVGWMDEQLDGQIHYIVHIGHILG